MSTIGLDNQDLSDAVGDHESADDTIEIRTIFEPSDTPVFPIDRLTSLNYYLNQSKWVVPVLPDSDLEILIKATIALAKEGKDEKSKHCRRFCRYGLLSSFQKTFQDEAVDGWDCQVLHFIYMNALLAVELCAIKAGDDSVSILDLENILFDPETRFQIHSIRTKPSYWKIQHGERNNGTLRYTHITPLLPHLLAQDPSDQPLNTSHLKEYAHPNPPKRFAPILMDFINLFGRLGGFDKLTERFTRPNALDDFPLDLLGAYLYPFSLCCEYLHPDTIRDFFVPIVDIIIPYILEMAENGTASTAQNELKSESLTDLCYYLRSFLLIIPERENQLEKVEMACLNLILRSLQFASFSKRMNALNDLNRLFSRLSLNSVATQPVEFQPHYPANDPLNIEQVANWMNEKKVLSLMLRENLHQPQYVEKVEKIIRFMIKHNYLTKSDLDRIWDAQDGKHEAIVKNVFDMLAKLALEFNPEQLDHLFVCFQRSWAHATKRQCEHLIDLICRLAEEDRDGLMAQKVLDLLWDLAVDAESSTEISDFALKAHAKILDHNNSEVGMQNRMQWLTKLVGFISQGPTHQFLLSAIKQFIDLCNLFPEQQYTQQAPYRIDQRRMREIKRLNYTYNLCEVTVQNIVECMTMIRQGRLNASTDGDSIPPVSLTVEVPSLLRLLRYLLIEGSLCLTLPLMQQLWTGMLGSGGSETENLPDTVERAKLVTMEDRELCFDWFSQLPPKAIHLEHFRAFFDQNIIQVDPANLTPSGMKLFQNFFYQINLSDGLLPAEPVVISSSSQFHYLMDSAQLHGIVHIWRMLLDAPSAVAAQAMELLQQLYTNLSPRLMTRQKELIEDLLQTCFSRLKGDYDTIRCLLSTPTKECTADAGVSASQITSDVNRTVDRMVRVIQLVQYFISRDDLPATAQTTGSPKVEFQRIPLKRAWVGSSFFLSVTFYSPMNEAHSPTTHLDPPEHSKSKSDVGFSMSDTLLFPVHANMTIGELRAQLLALRLPALRGTTAPPPQSSIPSNDLYTSGVSEAAREADTGVESVSADTAVHNYKLELYVNPARESTHTTTATTGLPLGGVLVDPLEDDMSVLGLLAVFPEWPAAFLHEPNLDRVINQEELPPRLSIVANVVHVGPHLSYDFRMDDVKGCLRKTSIEHEAQRQTVASTQTQLPLSSSPNQTDLTAPGSVQPTADCNLQPLSPPETSTTVRDTGTTLVKSLHTENPANPELQINPQSFKGPSEANISHSLEFNSSAQRSQFLLQLAKVAMELNSDQLFSSVLDVLLCLPAPETLIERLRAEIATAALAAVAPTNKSTADGVESQMTKSPLNGTYLGNLLSAKQLNCDQPTPDDMSRLMELYYALQVLYSLCLPTAAISQCHDMVALTLNNVHSLSQEDVFLRLPLWYNASQLTLQFLRVGGLSLLLSCPLLNPCARDQERTATRVVHNTILDLIRLWLIRLLRLLLTTVAFLLVSLRHHHSRLFRTADLNSSRAPIGSTEVDRNDSVPSVLVKRVEHLCNSFKSPVRVNNPITGGGFFLVRHADWVTRVAISLGVTCSEVERHWLPSSYAGVDNLLLLVFGASSNGLPLGQSNEPKESISVDEDGDSACVTDRQNSNLDHSARTGHSSGSDPANKRRWSAVSPKRMENHTENSSGSGFVSPSSTASKVSGVDLSRSRRPGFSTDALDDFHKQIIQSLQCGQSAGMVAIEAIACLPFCVALFPNSHLIELLSGTSTTVLTVDNSCTVTWTRFVQDLIFSRSELLRYAGLYGLYQMVTLSPSPTISLCDSSIEETFLNGTSESTLSTIHVLFSFLSNQAVNFASQSIEFFRLLALLLRHVHCRAIPFSDAVSYLVQEVDWIRQAIAHRQTRSQTQPVGDLPATSSSTSPDSDRLGVPGTVPPIPSSEALDTLLYGHMHLCSSLLLFHELGQMPHTKSEKNVSPIMADYAEFEKMSLTLLTKDIIQTLLFPAREQSDLHPMADGGAFLSDLLLTGVFELLLAIVKRSPFAVHLLSSLLCRSYFPDDFDLSTYSWQYSPPAISNHSTGTPRFVGLRNGGATCYMNSILQQLFALIPIRNAVLSARPEQRLQQDPGANETAEKGTTVAQVTASDAPEPVVPASSDSTEVSSIASNGTSQSAQPSPDHPENATEKPLTEEQTHHLKVLFHTQSIFGHLTHSLLQSYKPVEFWREFRFSSEQLNIREQHDAVEFMQTVGNDLDEALHLCGMPKAVEQVLGGTFADQKLCIDCPHRYSRNESFTILSVDIRNHTNLLQSLEQYVKGDRLEGDNAYWCEACNAKVTTLKRMCIDRLPLVLAIQLKRFDYDWDRGMAIKFNDYFEFPRELDMHPYTVQGLGHHVPEVNVPAGEEDSQDWTEPPPPGSEPSVSPSSEQPDRDSGQTCTRYTLRGVVVHSGQAGGGHYYSFIRQYCPETKTYRWYKYDDTEVSPSPMDNEDEARGQWFGGEDQYDFTKFTYSWSNKRWWCAYILFYEREDFQSQLGKLSVMLNSASATPTSAAVVTPRVKKIVHRENVEYLHQKMQFHPLLADFVLNMTRESLDMCARMQELAEDLALTSLRLLINFCFAIRFQNVARDWQRWIPLFFRIVAIKPLVRQKFVQWAFFSSPDRAAELLFECPYAEVRFLFGSLIVYIARTSASDPCQSGSSCMRALQQVCDAHATSTKPAASQPELNSVTAREESAANLLGAFICTKPATDPHATPCTQPNLVDCLLQLIIYQLSLSPAEWMRHTGPHSGTIDQKPLSYTQVDSSNETSYGSPGKTTPGTSYSKGNNRYGSYHPLVWSQYFSIFLDYANTDEASRKRLLQLGVPEQILRYAFKNQSAFTTTTSSYGVSWLGSATASSSGPRSAESVKQGLERILYTVWEVCMQADQPIAPTVEETYHQLAACLNSVVLALTTNTSSSSSYWDFYATGSGSGTGGGVGVGGSPTAMTVQHAGIVKLWTLLSLLIRSLDVSSLLSVSSPPSSATPEVEPLAHSSTEPPPEKPTEPNSHPMGDSTVPTSSPSHSVEPSVPLDRSQHTVTAVDKRSRCATDQTHKNPYATSSVPLYPISQSIAMFLIPKSPTRFVSHGLRSWLNASTLEAIAGLMMFLCYENMEFSSVILNGLVWAIKNCQLDTSLTISLLQSILTVPDSYKRERLRYALTTADQTGFINPLPPSPYQQSITQYTKVIKFFMELLVKDADAQAVFQSDEQLISWLRQWIAAIERSLETSSNVSQPYWYMTTSRPNKSQDAFILLAHQVLKILSVSDDVDPGASSGGSEVPEEDDADACPSDVSHYDENIEHDTDHNSSDPHNFFPNSLHALEYEPSQVFLRTPPEYDAPPPDFIALDSTDQELLETGKTDGTIPPGPETLQLHPEIGGDTSGRAFHAPPESSPVSGQLEHASTRTEQPPSSGTEM